MTVSTFTYAGAVTQTYTVPANGLYSIAMWGAGGGAGRVGTSTLRSSGAGAAIEVSLTLAAGDVLTMEVGQGGGFASGTTSGTFRGGDGGWPDGGWGGGFLTTRGSGGGGGSTRLYLNGVLIAVAGAGGGGGTYTTNNLASGAGGYPTGQAAQGTGTEQGGTGGSQTAGGFDGNDPTNVAKTGGNLSGGKGAGNVSGPTINTSDDGGGGGGGWYGGGGGGTRAGGGGGSSWIAPAYAGTAYLTSGNRATPARTDSPYYTAGVGVGRNVNTNTAGGHGAVVIDNAATAAPITVTKATGYVALQQKPEFAVSKTTLYVVLKEADPTPVDFEMIIAKATAYAVVAPGINGPLSLISHAASEIVHGGLPRARVSQAAIEALQSRKGAARVSGVEAEMLFTRKGASRITHSSLEVLRSTAEVTVQALVSHAALSVLYRPDDAVTRVSHAVVEVLMASDQENERFAVVSLMN